MLIKQSTPNYHVPLKYMRRAHGILYLWQRTKPVKMEKKKKKLFSPTKISHLEGIHLVRIFFFFRVFFFFFFWTISLGESHCAAANSKRRLFCKSPLESGSKAFSLRLNLWLKYLILPRKAHAISFLPSLPCTGFPLHFIPPACFFALAVPSISHLFSLPFIRLLTADLVALIIHTNAEWDVRI